MKSNQVVQTLDLSKETDGLSSNLSFFIGRADTCHLILDDPQISREHAELQFTGVDWKVKRISEFTPLVVNGELVNEAQLNSGDLISVGPFVISVFIAPVVPVTPPPEQIVAPVAEEAPVVEEDALTEVMPMDEPEADLEVDTDGETENNDVEEFDVSEFGDSDSSDDESDGDDFSPMDETDEDNISDDDFSSDDGFGDDGFGDDGDDEYGVSEYDDESTRVFSTFAKFDLEIFGEHAPYDRYTINAPEIYIGRNPDKCQIVLDDSEVSGVHAVIKKNNIICTLQDLQSGNGTLLNGERINTAELTNNDEFIIGSTTFTVKVGSDLIEQEKGRLMPVAENQVVEVEEVHEVDADFGDADVDFGDDDDGMSFGEEQEAPKSLVGKLKLKWQGFNTKQKIIYGVLILAALMFLLPEGNDTKVGPADGKKKVAKVDKSGNAVSAKKRQKKVLTPEQLEYVSSRYQLAKQLFDTGKYPDAILELEAIFAVDSDYKGARQLYELAKKGVQRLEKLARQKQAEKDEAERQTKIKFLLDKAVKAVDLHEGEVARELFSQILALDPENFDVPPLKNRLEAWEREKQRKELEKVAKEEERKRRVSKLAPGKNLFLKKDWFNAIIKLEEFLKIKNMDEDLIKEGTDMLVKSKKSLNRAVGPLIGKARSLKEGQDLKAAYEHYLEALKHDPLNAEALNEINDIRETLNKRARKVYREAIVSESLSLFKDAKEKFQEVQQIAPSDSEYYRKATDKLKEYLE